MNVEILSLLKQDNPQCRQLDGYPVLDGFMLKYGPITNLDIAKLSVLLDPHIYKLKLLVDDVKAANATLTIVSPKPSVSLYWRVWKPVLSLVVQFASGMLLGMILSK
jgi:hypothetical protein